MSNEPIAPQKSGGGCLKWGAGCSVVALILIAIIGVAGYFGYKQFGGMFGGVGDMFKGAWKMAELESLNDDILNQAPYTGPEDKKLSEQQVQQFLGVQEQMKTAISTEMEELRARQDELKAIFEGEPDPEQVVEAMKAISTVSAALVTAKEAQVAALNSAGMSYSEYQWIQEQAFASFGMPNMAINLSELKEKAQEMAEGGSIEMEISETHPDNRMMLAPYQEQLQESLQLAIFGL